VGLPILEFKQEKFKQTAKFSPWCHPLDPLHQWQDVRDKHKKNVELRALLCNIPYVDVFINRRAASYIGKIDRGNETTYPKNFLAAWINGSRKNGAP
jgi:hypothetical protein